jgi:hypothetical protein
LCDLDLTEEFETTPEETPEETDSEPTLREEDEDGLVMFVENPERVKIKKERAVGVLILQEAPFNSIHAVQEIWLCAPSIPSFNL